MSGSADFAWMDDALCAQVGFEIFFPHKGDQARAAISTCRLCPVKAPCLEFGMRANSQEEDGGVVYGGTHHEERNRLRKEEAA